MRERRHRPWKVFVQQIGPSFSFASEERAMDRAAELVERERYAAVDVYSVDANRGTTRVRFSHDGEPILQVLDPDVAPLAWRDACSCMREEDGSIETPSGSCPEHGWMVDAV